MILALTTLTLTAILEFIYILSLRQTTREAVERVRSAYEGNQALLKVIAEYRGKEPADNLELHREMAKRRAAKANEEASIEGD